MKISAKTGNRVLEVVIERENGRYVVDVDGVRYDVDSHKLEGDFFSILTGNRSYEISVETTRDGYRVRHGAAVQLVTLSDPSRQAREAQLGSGGPESIVSVMPGKIVRLLVGAGDEVCEGQGVIVVEAMKMENEIAAPRAGRVRSFSVEIGQTVESGTELLVIE
jgi:biotin carboxyl carrier protein